MTIKKGSYMIEKKNILLSLKNAKAFESLSDKQAGALIKAVFKYQIDSAPPRFLDRELLIAFAFVKQEVDYNNAEYEKRCMVNRENGALGAEFGRLGGRPKTPRNPARALGKPPETPKNPERTPKTPDNDVDNDNDKDKDSPFAALPPPVSEIKNREKQHIDAVFYAWNEFAKKKKLPQIVSLSETRRRKLQARLKEGMDILSVLAAAKRQSFLFGNNKQNWTLTFDFLIDNDKNWLKVLEGAYGFDIKAPITIRPLPEEEPPEEKSPQQEAAEKEEFEKINQKNPWLKNLLNH
jgi:hypothetical protein